MGGVAVTCNATVTPWGTFLTSEENYDADGRAVLGSHDGTNQPLTLFVADRAGDLSSGTLYAAKFDQKSAENGGTFALSWIKLGHASEDELKAMVDGGIKVSDMFETADAATDGFTEITTGGDKKSELLKVKNQKAAAFLEMKCYAGMVGALRTCLVLGQDADDLVPMGLRGPTGATVPSPIRESRSLHCPSSSWAGL